VKKFNFTLLILAGLTFVGACASKTSKAGNTMGSSYIKHIDMVSPESRAIRETIEKDTLNLDISIDQKRRLWDEAARKMPLPQSIRLKTKTYAGINNLWVSDSSNSNSQIVIFYVHGGGLVEGSSLTTRELGSRLSIATGMPVLIPDYSLAPENPFPTALNELSDIYLELLENGFDPSKIIFGGDSSGAGLTLSTLLLLKREQHPLPAGLFMISPSLDLTLSGESMQSRKNIDPFTSEEVLRYCAKLYAPKQDFENPLISPLFGDLSGLPPTMIQVGDHEILLSDSTRAAEAIHQSGGQVELNIWSEMWHVWQYNPELPEAELAIDEIQRFIFSVLDLSSSSPQPQY
jgi:monoterpene epsilon-lactone hydrolase